MRRSLRSWLWRVPIEQEVEEELAFHLEMRRREGKPLDAAEVERLRRAPNPDVVIFSESLWRSRFAADASLIGTPVRLNGEPFTVVGVIPDRAELTRPAGMWTPMPQVPFLDQRTVGIFEVVGRLKPGVTSTRPMCEIHRTLCMRQA